MLLVVGCTFVLQVLIIQFAGAFFGTVPLGIAMWGKLFALAFAVIVLSEVIKVFARLFQKKRHNKKHNHWIKNKTVCTKRYIRPFVIFCSVGWLLRF